MIGNKIRKIVAVLLSVLMIVASVPITAIAVETETAAEQPTVKIVSFLRGEQDDYRSSELLEAEVTGYNGNLQDLTYVWTSTLGTYLYVYNSHNMYYIEETDGEIEIYNSDKEVPASTKMANNSRAYDGTFSGKGYRWAAIYGSVNSGVSSGQGALPITTAYEGTITVTVFDGEKELCTDSHTGTVTSSGFWWNREYTYDGIVDHNLPDDIDHVAIGIFYGEKRNVKNLLGESGIVHITCVESVVNDATVRSGAEYISLYQENGDYYIEAIPQPEQGAEEGHAELEIDIEKSMCKFHEYSSGTAYPDVYIFKKPSTDTTAYTLTLTDNIDSRCDYFIDGRQGVKQDDGTILFDGLTPNTEYMVEVRGTYQDKAGNIKYAYAYVYDTTKPIYTGTVEVYLDGTYDSATHTATGTRVNFEDVSAYSTVYAKEVNSNVFIQLTKKADSTGVYSSVLDRGSYELFYSDATDVNSEDKKYVKIDDQLMIMHESDRTRYVFYNSVKYKLDESATEFIETQYHLTDSSVNIRSEVPNRDAEGLVFAGWKDEDGNIYQPDELLTSNIAKPYVLTAQWKKGINVYVNFTINHYDKNNGHYVEDDDRHNISFDLMSKDENAEGNYSDVFTAPINISWDGQSDFESAYFVASREYSVENGEDLTLYTNYNNIDDKETPVLANVLPGKNYTVEVAKPHYEIISVNSQPDSNGDIVVDVVLRYNPKNADLNFTVKFDDEATALMQKHPEYKPAAVNVKVLSWYTSDYNEKIKANTWEHITQHHDTFVTLYVGDNADENYEMNGSYPVWMHNSSKSEYYYYRIKVVSYVLQDGTVVNTENVSGYENIQYLSTDDRYLATMSVNPIAPNTDESNKPTGSSLSGAHFKNDTTQSAELLGVISLKTYNVTFDPNGGHFADGVTVSKTATEQLVMPNLDDYAVKKDGGYVFDGWKLISGENIEEPVKSGVDLYSDVELQAQWKDPLTVQGTVFVAGYYHLDNDTSEVRKINLASRAHHVTVYLQKIDSNGYPETISTQKINVAYNDTMKDVDKPMGAATYKFEAIPDDGHKYRILINNPNYNVLYQNEPESIDETKMTNYDSYNVNDFMADFTSAAPNNVADINAFMEFVPHKFTLHYQVDANAIGKDFRPVSTEVLILHDEDPAIVDPHRWPPIADMVEKNGEEEVKTGLDTALNDDGIGNKSHEVWMAKVDGHTLYNYAVLLKDYTVTENNATKELAFDAATAPFFVYYNGTARYSALEGLDPEHQTQLLTITLYPRNYPVRFHMNFEQNENDYVTGMDKYYLDEEGYRTYHTWSFETKITDAIPERAGYKFLGWYDSPEGGTQISDSEGNIVIEAAEAKETDLYARWEKIHKIVFHANNTDYTGDDVFRTYYRSDVVPTGETNFALNSDNTITSFYDIPEFEYLTHNKYIFKGWYYEDGTPISWSDKYWAESYDEDIHIYAQWIDVGTVTQEAGDTKLSLYNGNYPGYDLMGVQIRDIEKETDDHYGEAGTGLRFVTVLSENVYKQINELNEANKDGAEYGYALAKTATANKYANGQADHEIEYKDANVNGVDTTQTHKYVSNVKCSGVPDHYNGTGYRLYTAVVTYKGLEGAQLETAQATELLARSYIRYTDANGLLRTYHNNYNSTISPNGILSGCSASFKSAYELTNPAE